MYYSLSDSQLYQRNRKFTALILGTNKSKAENTIIELDSLSFLEYLTCIHHFSLFSLWLYKFTHDRRLYLDFTTPLSLANHWQGFLQAFHVILLLVDVPLFSLQSPLISLVQVNIYHTVYSYRDCISPGCCVWIYFSLQWRGVLFLTVDSFLLRDVMYSYGYLCNTNGHAGIVPFSEEVL